MGCEFGYLWTLEAMVKTPVLNLIHLVSLAI